MSATKLNLEQIPTIEQLNLTSDASIAVTGAYPNVNINATGTFSTDLSVNGYIIGKGPGNVVNNIYFGTGFNSANTTANHLIGIGNSVFNAVTTATINIGIGGFALNALTTGQNNVGIGFNALRQLNTGSTNVGVGTSAGTAITIGSNNALFGTSAGIGLTGGSNNTMVGSSTGTLNHTGVGNVFIGYFAGYNETGDNKLYIANSNTVTPLLQGDFAASTLIINGKLSSTISPVNPTDVVRLQDLPAGVNLIAGTNITITGTYPNLTISASGAANQAIRETPSGALDGSNLTYVLAHTPVLNTEQIFVNGVLMDPGNDYTINGATISYLGPALISNGTINDRMRATYNY